jgi:hypothetical protein
MKKRIMLSKRLKHVWHGKKISNVMQSTVPQKLASERANRNRNDFFLNRRNSAKKAAAKHILYQTIASAVIVIKAPNMAVKPK